MTSNIPQNDRTLIHLAEQRDTSGAVERHLLGKLEEVNLQPECGHRHVVRLPGNMPRSSACNASLPHVPGAQLGRLLARHHRAEWCTVQVPLVPLRTLQPPSTTAAWTPPSRNACVFISSGYSVATPARALDPLGRAPTRPRRSSCW